MVVKRCKDEQSFEQQLLDADSNLVIVHFTANWSYPCQQLAPQLVELSEEFVADGVIFLDVEVDQNPEVSKKFDINAFPTFAFFVEKEIDDRFQGADLDKLKTKIIEYVRPEAEEEADAQIPNAQ
eukprot:TRINITY_DN35978_c0_g1_i1.p2 TRINITY_DN35978_c0_g1~~TRINITY_DN35978_c0_g1_i1.p2  ORF type:complete len:125 (-),score=45.31 TRINITY_DN35978_c0_g1_i1:94-468(-)